MTEKVHDRYSLRTIHQEIDLYDRKLAHLEKFDTFNTPAEKDDAVRKMKGKRTLLVQTAQRLAEQGISFNASELPRSFRTEAAPAPAAPVEASEEPQVLAARQPGPMSHFAGTALGLEESMEVYRNSKAGQPRKTKPKPQPVSTTAAVAEGM